MELIYPQEEYESGDHTSSCIQICEAAAGSWRIDYIGIQNLRQVIRNLV